MPRAPRKKEEIEEVRNKILDYALNIICNEGYESLTMRKLGDRMGCAAKTIYNYYNGKEEIYIRILIKGFQALNERADEALKGVVDPVEKLRLLCNVYISFGLDNVYYYNLMFSWDVPKYTSYLGTYFESAAKEEKDIAMYYAAISEAAISEALSGKSSCGNGRGGKVSKKEAIFHLVRLWSALHGYVSLHISQSFREYNSNTLQFRERIIEEMLTSIKFYGKRGLP